MNKLNKLIITLGIFAGFFLNSCKKFVEVPAPRNQLVTSAAFQDSANATASVVGLYINLIRAASLGVGSGGVTVYTGLTSDEIYTTENCCEDWEFYTNSISKSNILNESSLYGNAYSVIYGANACIEGLNASKGLSPSVKNRLLGESKFVRAFIYFQLINLYGEVPLITTTDYIKNKVEARSSIDLVFKQIETDLIEAQNFIPLNYVTADRLRPNRLTATALLSKVYLYQKKWTESETAASEIINSGIYNLETDINKIFLATSKEAIWKMRSVYTGIETWEGYFILPGSPTIIPKYIITDSLLNVFDSTDQRKLNWMDSNVVGGVTYYYPFKYKLGYDGLDNPFEHYVVFRLAEQYLIRAEARAQQNRLIEAGGDLNLIRNRAGLQSLQSSLDQAQVIAAVEKERRIELFCEWGNRWFDLKRWNKANDVLAITKAGYWQSTDALFPIPQVEIERNPTLSQNQGY